MSNLDDFETWLESLEMGKRKGQKFRDPIGESIKMSRERIRGFQSSFSGNGPGYHNSFTQDAYNSDNYAAGDMS